MPRKKRLGTRHGKKKMRASYTDADKRQAVIEYWVTGTIRGAAKALGMPHETLAEWRRKEWWHDMTQEVRDDVEDRIEADLVEILTLSTTRVKDGLREGDEKLVWDKEKQKHVKIKVLPTAKEAAVITGISFDKRRLSMNMPTSISAQSGEKQMAALMSQFQKLAQDHESYVEKKVNAIEGESEDVS
jgi:transposase-like protein